MIFFPLRIHTHYSLLQSTIKIDKLIEKCKENEYPAIGLTDYTSISGTVPFYKECKKNGIRPLLGCELIVSDNPEISSTITLICKNKNGWKKLLHIVSESNDKENFHKNPSLTRKRFEELDLSDFIVIDGYLGSLASETLFHDFDGAFLRTDYDDLAENCLHRDWKERLTAHYSHFYQRFGEAYFLELPIFECDTLPSISLIKNCIHSTISSNFLCDGATHYLNREDSVDQRVLLASKLKTTLRKLDQEVLKEPQYNKFLTCSSFYLPSAEDIPTNLHAQEYQTHEKLLAQIEEFDILSPPILPKFGGDKSEIDQLKEICRDGWREKIIPLLEKNPDKRKQYEERVTTELKVIEEAELAGYFLIVHDYVNKFKKEGHLIGPARGSCGGCLVAYLMDIILLDPIPYGLIFERFFNASRKGALPDIDMDFPPYLREDVIAYLKQKYGEDRVYQTATFGRLAGKAAVKEVLRIHEVGSFDLLNRMTEHITEEGKISDQLEEMDHPSVILWSLQNKASNLKDYCYIEDGELKGEYAKYFAQAIRIEGCYKTQGKHASAVFLANQPIANIAPLVKASRSSDKIIGFEMEPAQECSLVKMDILGLSALTKIQNTVKDINLKEKE